jgi:hypothetical protein
MAAAVAVAVVAMVARVVAAGSEVPGEARAAG